MNNNNLPKHPFVTDGYQQALNDLTHRLPARLAVTVEAGRQADNAEALAEALELLEHAALAARKLAEQEGAPTLTWRSEFETMIRLRPRMRAWLKKHGGPNAFSRED
jgi:hypothetical protein